MDAQGVDVRISIRTPFFGYHLTRRTGGPWRRQRRDRRRDPAVAAALRRPRHPAVGREGVHRRAGARGDRPRLEGGRTGHDRERRELGRTEVSAAVQGRRGHGGGALLPPTAPAQLHDGPHDPLWPLQQSRRHRRRRDRGGHADLRRGPRRLPRAQGLHRPRTGCFAWGASIGAGKADRRAGRAQHPPSTYQRRLYYDTVVEREGAALPARRGGRRSRGVGAPVPWHPSPVVWVQAWHP